MNKPRPSKVTIITPVFNNKDDIIQAVRSVVKQSYPHWEYLIVDDCSKDGTYELLQKEVIKLGTKRITLMRNARNKGTYISINKAIKYSEGEYICLLGSDDTFHPKKLERQVKVLDEHPEIMVCEAWYKRGNTVVENNVAAQMFRRTLINKLGYFDSIRFGADSEYKHRIYKYYGGEVFTKINEVLYFAKIRRESLTRAPDTGRKDVRLDYKDKFKQWHKNALKDDTLYMKYPLKKRPFPVNPIMLPTYTPEVHKYKNRKKIEKLKQRDKQKKI